MYEIIRFKKVFRHKVFKNISTAYLQNVDEEQYNTISLHKY